MISKRDFVTALQQMGGKISMESPELNNFENVAAAADKVRTAMPGIGFMSASSRMNCFMAVARHLDALIERGEIDLAESLLVILILRLQNTTSRKAVSIFDIRGDRLGVYDRAELPKSAREYLAGIQYYGR